MLEQFFCNIYCCIQLVIKHQNNTCQQFHVEVPNWDCPNVICKFSIHSQNEFLQNHSSLAPAGVWPPGGFGRNIVHPNDGFWRQLRDLEAEERGASAWGQFLSEKTSTGLNSANHKVHVWVRRSHKPETISI